MGQLVPLFLLSDGMGQFVREKLEYINIYKLTTSFVTIGTLRAHISERICPDSKTFATFATFATWARPHLVVVVVALSALVVGPWGHLPWLRGRRYQGSVTVHVVLWVGLYSWKTARGAVLPEFLVFRLL